MDTRSSPVRRVMLLDLSWKQTGYVAAALSASGIETTLLTTAFPDPTGLGHFCTQVRTPHPRAPEYVPFLRREIARVRPDLVIPLCETLMETLWDLKPPCEIPIYPATTEEQRQVLRDRRRFYERAARAGIALPPWMPVGSAADLESAIARFGYPFVLRGTAGCAGSQVRIVSCAGEATEALEALKRISPGEPFAQAFVAGTRHLVGGFFSNGEAICLFPQEAIEAHPPITGPSVRVRAYVDETLLRAVRALFADLQWTGMACAEFIRDELGNFLLLEMNPRPWASLEVAERSGARICHVFAESLAGRSVDPPARYRTGVSNVVLEGFLMSRRARDGGIGSTLRTLSLREWLDCLRAVPWSRPRLALHVLRRLYRELARDRPQPKAPETPSAAAGPAPEAGARLR